MPHLTPSSRSNFALVLFESALPLINLLDDSRTSFDGFHLLSFEDMSFDPDLVSVFAPLVEHGLEQIELQLLMASRRSEREEEEVVVEER